MAHNMSDDLSPLLISIELDGVSYTAVPTGISSRGFGAQQLAAATMHGGMIVHGDRYSRWPVQKMIERSNELYLCGPPIANATTFLEAIDEEEPGSSRLREMLGVLLASTRHSFAHDLVLCNAQTNAFTDDGAVLLLRRELADRINAALPLEHRRRVSFPYRHPHLSGMDAELYQLAAFVFRALAGAPVCSGTTVAGVERCHSSARKEPLHMLQPAISTPIAELIDGVLTGTVARDIESHDRLADLWGPRGDHVVETNTSTEVLDQRRAAANESFARTGRREQRKAFRRRYGTRVLAITVAVLLVLSIPATIVRRSLQPSITTGLEVREVVDLFYDAWTDLDHTLMAEIVARGVARERIREVTDVFVVDRVQTAYGEGGRLVSVEEWIAAGRPEDGLPYGVHAVTITIVYQTETEARAIAEFTIWRPEGSDTGTYVFRSLVRDELQLRRVDRAWEIESLVTRVIDDLDPIILEREALPAE